LYCEGDLRLASCSVPVGGPDEYRFKGSDYSSVELTLDALGQSKPRYLTWHCITIGALRGHCVVGVSDSKDSRQKRDLFANKTVRIASAINPLMMVPDDACDFCVVLNVGKDALADYRVLLHLATLFEAQRPWLLKQTGREANLSDVMNQST